MTLHIGEKIGEGGCSEVYAIGDGRILKLAKSNTSFEAARKEYRNNQIAWECGLPVPQPYQFIEKDGRPGLVVERIVGETLMERFIRQMASDRSPERNDADIRLTAQVLCRIHRMESVSSDLPAQRSSIKSDIRRAPYLRSDEKDAIISILDSLPPKQMLCHGDPNPGNLMIRPDGSVVILDWMNASIGNPEADLAEYILMIRYGVLPSFLPAGILNFFDSMREEIIGGFMDEYRTLTGMSDGVIAPWLVPIAARKLAADGIPDEEKMRLVRMIRQGLEDRGGDRP
ncbi:phosphotransferase family protein [Gorillibacterium sp. sgz5001074]|uniref:phosphotransferase family protein n=1 Tax=Gorillibacterium sp. sgz5001074 TaxID=3446695 RepID=UPI003F676552